MNHFLLTGNELVADWPQIYKDGNYTAWQNRPRYTCSKELLAMLKEGERYEINKHFTIGISSNGRESFEVAVPVEKTDSGYDDLDEILLSHGW